MPSNPLHDLLAWSTTNTDPSAPRPPPQKLDPAILDHILGKNDATKMREAMDVAEDASKTLDERMLAWNELELLVESLDNANDLSVLKLWPRIISSFSDPIEDIKVQALWVAGTAAQNNPKSQDQFLSHSPLPHLLPLLTTSSSAAVRSKALYALSSLVRHHPPAVRALAATSSTSTDSSSDGLKALSTALRDPDRNVRRKAAFLLSTLFTPSAVSQSSHSASTSSEPTPTRNIAPVDTEPTAHPGTHDPAALLSHLSGAALSAEVIKEARKAGVLDALVESLDRRTEVPRGANGEEEEVDEDYKESAWAAVVRAWKNGGEEKVADGEKTKVREAVKETGDERAKDWAIGGGVEQGDWVKFIQLIG